MPKRSSKPPADPIRAAHDVVRRMTESEDEKQPAISAVERRQIAAILGSRGGKKGGPARAKKLSAGQRTAIARRAARARWDAVEDM